MDRLSTSIKKIFPFCKNPRLSYSASINIGAKIDVEVSGSQDDITRWCETLGFSSPMDFVCPYYGDTSKNKFFQAMGQPPVNAESWGFTEMKIEFDPIGIVKFQFIIVSMNFKLTDDTIFKMGNIVSEMYLNDAVDEAILEVKRLRKDR